MSTLERRAVTGPAEREAALALVRACRAAARAVPWPSLGELRVALAAQPRGAPHAQIWADADGSPLAVALLWDESVLVSAVYPQAYTEALELDLLRWGWASAVSVARRRGERGCLFVPACSHDDARIALLAREGFVADEWRTLQMCRPLGAPIPEPSLPDGFRVLQAGARCASAAVVALHNEIFAGLAKTAADRRALRRAGSYRRALDLVAVAPDGRLAACCFGTVSPDEGGCPSQPVGWVERVGVRGAFRQRGLGRAVVLSMLHAMRAEGLGCALLTTGASNAAARRLFEACGFGVTCEICWYVRSQVESG
ncbi:MAG: GNAT family N-acetyltransferase [Chloroflexales bacterium]|nr:GNAT family N-acetyltransferase [Chloroflexales bacterium]